ncbi:trypsin-like peptidase domain-containing protein [Streptomyces sp. W16]|uniref:trypsin-like peptidase domain-containing protein n=1 Tax=Streptomyces sp. W16 TaxID=3076631 RepID=UPI00295C234A|nr:trypsin-like peptidase domain-containing protein [Streptomyces sp. W16]MDV9168637.1 trypsin-like peptidase domain-containing protein [Streptomyces sp. W16]
MTGLASRLAERPPWLARFPHPHGESAAGAGVLVGPRHVLTCAHVLEKQLGRPLPAPGPDLATQAEEIEVEFPFAGEPGTAGKRMRGTLVGWVPIPAARSGDKALPDAANDSGDVALLELESPVNFTPAPLACPPTLDSHRFSVHGFPDGDPVTRQANGVLKGASGQEGTWVQLDKESETGWAIEVGFSGAPVFDHSREAVVGIVVVRDKRGTRTGHMLPMSYLRTLWPEIRSNCRWRLDLEANYDAHWGPRARGSEPDSPTDEWFFTGRTEARRVIRDWLEGKDLSLAEPPILLVTGGPGSGKSALLAHSLVSADPRLAETVPRSGTSDPRPPIGAFDVALHLRGQTCDEMTAQLARALDVAVSDPDKLPTAVRKLPGGDLITVLADAVEEAADLKEAEKIAALLRELANTRRVRVLAAVRTAPAGTSRARILNRLGRDAIRIDLEDSRYLHRPDIAEYAIRRLTSEQTDTAQYRAYEPDQLRAIGEAVARKAGYNFLIAQLTTGWLLHRGEQELSPGEAGWEDELPTTVGDAMDAYLDTCGADTSKSRNLLTALAYARGDGLPRSDTWLHIADALGFRLRHSGDDLDEIFQSAAHYLVERVQVSSKERRYRLYHDALDQHLRKEKELEHPEPEEAITAALMKAVPGRDGERDWAEADAYTCEHVASHAAAGGLLDDLLTAGTEYLVHAAPRGLAPHLHRAQSEPAQLAAAVYRTSLSVHTTATPGVRRQVLALDAARAGATSLRDQLVDHIPAGDWAPLWATGSDFAPALRDVLTSAGPVSHVTCMVLHGTPVAITVALDPISRLGGDCTVEVWDLTTGSPLASRTIPKCEAVCTLPDGTPVAVTVGYDKTLSGYDETKRVWNLIEAVRVWNLVTGASIGKPLPLPATARHDGRSIFGVACTTVGDTPVVVIAYNDTDFNADTDNTVQAWDLSTGNPIGKPLASPTHPGRRVTFREPVAGHTRKVISVECAVLEGTPIVVTGDGGGTVRVWELATGIPLRTLLAGISERTVKINRLLAVTTMDGSPVVVTADPERTVRMWNLATGSPLGKPLGPTPGVSAVACTTVDGTLMAVTACYDKTVRLWDLATGVRLGELLTGHTEGLRALACTTVDGTPVAVTGSLDGTVRVWNLTTDTRLGKPLPGHSGQVKTLAYTVVHGISAAATAGDDGTVRMWNLATGTPLGSPIRTGHTGGVLDIACAVVDGTPVAITRGEDGEMRRGTARVWDLAADADMPLVALAPIGRSGAVAWMDGTPVAMSDDVLTGEVTALNVTNRAQIGQPLLGHAPHSVRGMACVVLDGTPIAMTSDDDQCVRVWDLATGTSVGEPMPNGRLVFSSMACTVVDGTLMAVSGDTGGSVQVWNPTTGTPLDTPVTGHSDWVVAVACTVLDGAPVAVTAGRDNTVRLWNLRTGEPAGILPTPHPRAVALTPGGDLIVGTGNDVAVFRRRPAHTRR